MPRIRAIIFDLDNTLVDFICMKEKACKAAVHAMIKAGLEMNEDEAYKSVMQTYFAVGIESDRAFTEFLKATNQFTHKILAAAINAYLKTKIEYAKPYPQVEQTLKTLQDKGVTLSIVTDAPKTKAYQRLLLMGIEHYFKFVIGYEDTEKTKTTSLPLQLAIKHLKTENPNLKNSEILMVGDSIERDLTPAKQLGLRTALAVYGRITSEAGTPDYELEDIRDLSKITQTEHNSAQ